MARTAYSSDVTDDQWRRIESLIPGPKPGGRPRKVNMREVINGILYLVRTGCTWRMLPHDFPPWGTVHDYYRRFRREGVWREIHNTLREKVRQQAGRQTTPSAGIIDSQSVKTTEKKGFAATTPGKRSKVANATSLWTR